MLKSFSLDRWLYKQFHSMRLRQVNYFSIWFILLFTILFALLVIHEEYKQFRVTIEHQRESYIAKEYEIMRTTAEQIEQILSIMYVLHEGDNDEAFFKLIDVFHKTDYQFILLFDTSGNPLEQSIAVKDFPQALFEGKKNTIIDTTLSIAHKNEEVLLLPQTIKGEYQLFVGHYLKPFHLQLHEQKEKLKKQLIRLMLEVVTLSFILFGFIFAILQLFNTLLKRDVDSFLDFFAHFKEGYKKMNTDEAFFDEFRSMSGSANEMEQTISSQKKELEELNRTLEERVQKKTLLLQELLESQKRFIRYAIHETNTPLSVIMTNIELYTMKRGRDEYLAKIEVSVKQIFNIYDDLSYLVKKDLIEYPKLQIDLEEYLKSRIRFFEEVASVMTLSFAFHSDCHKIPYINFNETKLQRIVDNNLTNAIKYTRRNETIHVSLECKFESATVSFSSRSVPIKDTEKIFEAYYRESRYRDGFGLGLNLVKSICDEENVSITLSSTKELTRFQYRFALENSAS